MADDFKGSNYIYIQPSDANVPITFKFNACSGTTCNDGSIPYGSTLLSSTVLAHRGDDTSVNASTVLVTAVTNSSNKVTAYLSYGTTLTTGIYHLVVKPTFDLAGTTRNMTRALDFDRVILGNR